MARCCWSICRRTCYLTVHYIIIPWLLYCFFMCLEISMEMRVEHNAHEQQREFVMKAWAEIFRKNVTKAGDEWRFE